MNRKETKTVVGLYEAPVAKEHLIVMQRNVLDTSSFSGGTEDMDTFSGNTEEWE